MSKFMNNVHNEDCLQWMRRQERPFIDATVTSPPYDGLRDYKGYCFDFEPIADELYRLTTDGGVLVWVVGDATVDGSETGTSFRQALYFKEVGFNLHDTMIYEKNTSSMPSGVKSNRYTQIFEYMFVFSKGKPKTHNIIIDKPNEWAGVTTWGKATKRQVDGKLKDSGLEIKPIALLGVRNNIWPFICSGGFGQKDDIAYEHPATFPEKLARDHIWTWSNIGDTVFDPFAGSGTTLLMAHGLGRKYVGCEMSSEYYDIIHRRFKKRYPEGFNASKDWNIPPLVIEMNREFEEIKKKALEEVELRNKEENEKRRKEEINKAHAESIVNEFFGDEITG